MIFLLKLWMIIPLLSIAMLVYRRVSGSNWANFIVTFSRKLVTPNLVVKSKGGGDHPVLGVIYSNLPRSKWWLKQLVSNL